MKEKIRGSIIGAALGDALGAPIEKLSHSKIKEMYGKVTDLNVESYKSKSRTHGKGYGRITDDTLLSIRLCEIYNEKLDHIDTYDVFTLIKKIFFQKMWVPEYQKEMPLIERLFYPEKYIFLSNYLASRDPRSAGTGNMVNCGAAMYMTPVGLVNACDPLRAYEEAINFGLSHQHSYGLEAAGVFAACVATAMIPGISMSEVAAIAINLAKDGTQLAIKDIVRETASMDKDEDNADKFHEIIKKYSPMGDNVERIEEKVGIPTENYTPSRIKSIEELPIAIGYCLLYEDNFMKAMTEGVNSGRDTDSIGVMIGAILGAKLGIQAINEELIDQLKDANRYDFMDIADKFYETVSEIHEKDRKRYINIIDMRKR